MFWKDRPISPSRGPARDRWNRAHAVWESPFFRKRLCEHFGAEAGTSHAEHDGVGKLLSLHALCIILIIGDIGFGRAVQPAQPSVLVVIGPDRFVLLPKPAD